MDAVIWVIIGILIYSVYLDEKKRKDEQDKRWEEMENAKKKMKE